MAYQSVTTFRTRLAPHESDCLMGRNPDNGLHCSSKSLAISLLLPPNHHFGCFITSPPKPVYSNVSCMFVLRLENHGRRQHPDNNAYRPTSGGMYIHVRAYSSSVKACRECGVQKRLIGVIEGSRSGSNFGTRFIYVKSSTAFN